MQSHTTTAAQTAKTVRVFYLRAYPMSEAYFMWSAELTHDRRILTEAEFKEHYSLMFTLPIAGASETDNSICETMFMAFNDYTKNPLSQENGGQRIVKESMTAHTSMSVGDIVVVGTHAYIAKGEGFELLGFEVA